MMKGLIPAAALAGLGALGLGVPPAAAQDKTVTLKIAHWLPPAHALHAAFDAWGKSVQEASGGTIKYQLFPAQQLGQAKDHYDMARDGIADLAYINPGYQPGRFPIVGVAEIPFLFSNGKSGSGAFDAWYRKYAAQEMGDVKVCVTWVHAPGTFHSKKKIARPDDVRGMKVRSANATVGRMVTMLGATNVQVSAPEAREAMERGVADAITFPWDSIILFGIDKAAKFHMDAPLYVSLFVLAMNKGTYEGMSAAQKKVIDNHCTTEWAEKISGPWADKEESGRDKLRGMAGHTLTTPTAAELEEWRKVVDPLVKEWSAEAAKKGLNPVEVLGELKDELKKRSAAF
jgi:TRAP-type transport system periplasmic protein